MGEVTLESLDVKIDGLVGGMTKLNKIVIGNGDPGLCEQVRNIDKRLDDHDIAIGMANNHALAAKEAVEAVKVVAVTQPDAPQPQVIVNTGDDIQSTLTTIAWRLIKKYWPHIIGYAAISVPALAKLWDILKSLTVSH